MSTSNIGISGVLTAARSAAVAIDETAVLGVLRVTGSERKSWLNGLVTCDLEQLGPGRAVYGLAVTPKGRVMADLTLVDDGEEVLILLPIAEVAAVAASFEHYLVMEDAELTAARPGEHRIVSVHGPKAAAILADAKGAGAAVGAVDRLGLGGGVAIAPASREGEVLRAVSAACAREGGAFAGGEAAEVLRLEQGIPRFGSDFGQSTYPQEASLEARAVSFDKGCYLGQEVVCMLQLRGRVKRKLVSLVLEEGTAAPGDAIGGADGQPVGELTSVAESPTLRRPIALGMVKLAFAAEGTELRVGEARGRVVALPDHLRSSAPA